MSLAATPSGPDKVQSQPLSGTVSQPDIDTQPDTAQQPDGLSKPDGPAKRATVVVKKYANRRLYNTETSSYITLDSLAEMIRDGRDFIVFDAKTNDDITRGVLTQIIVEEESKGRALLPTSFLRQLIAVYGDSVQSLMPRYLEQAMSSFVRQQENVRLAMEKTLAPFIPFPIEEAARQNMAVMERAMSLFSPFGFREPELAAPTPQPAPALAVTTSDAEVEAMRSEIEALRRELQASRAANAVVALAPHVSVPVPVPVPAPPPVKLNGPRRVTKGG